MLSKEKTRAYTDILKEELLPAMGCTEPIAIAYASAILRDALGGEPGLIRIGLSGNIIKNVKSVTVPATGGMRGIAASVAAGIISGAPEKKLEVLCALTPDDKKRISEYIERTPIEISELETDEPFELDVFGEFEGHVASLHITGRHTNLVSVKRDGEDITDRYGEAELEKQNRSANLTAFPYGELTAQSRRGRACPETC